MNGLNVDREFLINLPYLLSCPTVMPRGRLVRESVAHTTCVDMRYPMLMNPLRRLGYKFMAAEAHWILTGQNFVYTIEPYSAEIAKYSNDGVRFDGAYGPKVVDQMRYVVDALHKDIFTRQAIIGIWRDNPRDSNDIPCTLSLQFLYREGALNCISSMRSSDIWLGWPYDTFNFTMITSAVILELKQRFGQVIQRIGNLYIRPGSFHLYESNWKDAQDLLDSSIGIENCPRWNPHQYVTSLDLIMDLEIMKFKGREYRLKGFVG